MRDHTSALEETRTFRYDRAGNRVFAGKTDHTTDPDTATPVSYTYNRVNELGAITGSGVMPVTGTLDELAQVTVNGGPAHMRHVVVAED